MSLHVIGAGLGRTGTLSVKLALEQLGFAPCYHMVFYPRAKVLLTVRAADEWFESARATIFSKRVRAHIIDSPLEPLFETCVWGGHGRRIFDRALMTAEFRRHNDEVRRSIPAQGLLVYEVTQGWAPLCRFLGVPEPRRPFPHVNSRTEMQQLFDAPRATRNDSDALERISARAREHYWNRSANG